ncbi:MAG: dihydroorotase [Promethearchaeota archaeon]
MRILLKNGNIVTPDSTFNGNLVINGTEIERVERRKDITLDQVDYKFVIDCSDKFILAGVIDPHVHLRDMEQSYKETVETGTSAAINGGVTTVLAMPNTIPPLSTAENVKKYHKSIGEGSYSNIGIFAGLSEGFSLNQLKKMVNLGIFGLKIYPGSSSSHFKLNWNPLIETAGYFKNKFPTDGFNLSDLKKRFNELFLNKSFRDKFREETKNWIILFEETRKLGIPLLFHPDIPINRSIREEDYRLYIKKGYSLLQAYSNTYSILHETLHILFIFKIVSLLNEDKTSIRKKSDEAISQKIRIQFCHVSNPKSVELIWDLMINSGKINSENIDARIEVTPHHLFLHSGKKTDIPAFSKVLCPIREKKDNLKLLQYLKNGKITFIGTDHAPHTVEEKKRNFFETPSGFPGLDTYLPYVLSKAFNSRITLEDFTRYASLNPAKYFGLKNKGILKRGYDADVIIVKRTEPYRMKTEEFRSKAKLTPYPLDGLLVKIVLVFLEGKLVINKEPELYNKYPQLNKNVGSQLGKLLLYNQN